jgi:serine-type D-Ala-D-Ala carboxypeptidase (penicillin-binding protein 5/6)
MKRRLYGFVFLVIILLSSSSIYLFTFTPVNARIQGALGMLATPTPPPTPTPLPPTPTPLPPTPTLIPTPTPSPTPQGIQASGIYLLDATTNQVLFNQDSTAVVPTASTAKIMTAILAIEDGDLNHVITIQQDALDRVQQSGGGSSAQLQLGDQIKLGDLLYGLLLPSGADAATAIADYIGGSTPAFVQLMNNKAAALGMTHTHFVDADGLTIDPPVSVSTAQDMTKLAIYAMSNATFANIVRQTEYYLAPTEFHHGYPWPNTNGLLTTYSGMLGVKTGHSSIAGYCLVFEATRNGQYLIGTIMGSPDEAQRNADVTKLLDEGFAEVGA